MAPLHRSSTRLVWLGVVVLLGAVGSLACGTSRPALSGEIKVDGSSSVYPLTTAVTEGFVKQNPQVRMSVAQSGTGGGFAKFCQDETDIEDASRPIKADEREACAAKGVEFVEVPVAYDALTVIVHPKNTWAESITVAELRKLWEPDAQSKVTRWSQVRAGWPDAEVHLFGTGKASGTFDYFTEAVTGRAGAARTDYAVSVDHNAVAEAVAKDESGLGFVGHTYFEAHRTALRAASIDDGDDSVGRGAVAPTAENVQRGTYRPLARILLLYVNLKSLARPEVRAFVDYYLKEDEQFVAKVGGIAMTSHVYDLVRRRVAAHKPGTVFTVESASANDLELLLAEQQ